MCDSRKWTRIACTDNEGLNYEESAFQLGWAIPTPVPNFGIASSSHKLLIDKRIRESHIRADRIWSTNCEWCTHGSKTNANCFMKGLACKSWHARHVP